MTDTTLPLTTADLVLFGLEEPTRQDATRRLTEVLAADGRITDVELFLDDVRAREEMMATGLPGGIAFPHARSAAVGTPSVAIGISQQGIDFGADDGPAHLIFLIAAPPGAGQLHLVILARLARKLINEQFRRTLRSAENAEQIAAIIQREILLPE
ncbi:PTS sugar transporter subunit IIA [Planctomonas psychrotolerans]|uniref:PTS sugar transporter subunit IIA n=1 Tax=Planctomonas psychrotolerans TaxID=2528712 RepID=UPI0012385B09|nr:PTS sugar transporter subunit IIA [Planctomonas psychrotolerans]